MFANNTIIWGKCVTFWNFLPHFLPIDLFASCILIVFIGFSMKKKTLLSLQRRLTMMVQSEACSWGQHWSVSHRGNNNAYAKIRDAVQLFGIHPFRSGEMKTRSFLMLASFVIVFSRFFFILWKLGGLKCCYIQCWQWSPWTNLIYLHANHERKHDFFLGQMWLLWILLMRFDLVFFVCRKWDESCDWGGNKE